MIIALLNHKGSVGKTSTAFNTASTLLRRGVDAMCVDLDYEQGNLTEQCEGGNVFCVSPTLSEFPVVLASYGEKGCKVGPIKFVECPPRNDIENIKPYNLTIAALKHAHLALVLTPCEYMAVQGIYYSLDLIAEAKQDNPRLQTRVLATMYSAPFKEERDELRASTDFVMARTVIPRAAIVAKAAKTQQPIWKAAPKSAAARAFDSLANEIIEWREGKWNK